MNTHKEECENVQVNVHSSNVSGRNIEDYN